MTDLYEMGVAHGASEEREWIVAWLRAQPHADECNHIHDVCDCVHVWESALADAIERGEHRPGTSMMKPERLP